MKHQYFGDVSDYKKYSVLRAISDNGNLRTMVAWMLTPNDERNDGNVNKYLNSPSQWRQFEPDIFDFLYEAVVVNKTKDLKLVQEKGLVPGTNYFWDILADNLVERRKYFEKLQEASKEHEIVFLDPDNGIATASITKGRKNSSKYIFWDEISDLWNQDHSLLIYQHFPRVNRLDYINKLFGQMKEKLDVHEAYAIKTTFMVYFLLIQDKHKLNFNKLGGRLNEKWSGTLDTLHLKSTA